MEMERIYMLYTLDEYELPVLVSDNATELAKTLGIQRESIYRAVARKSKTMCGYGFEIIYLEPEEALLKSAV